MSVLQRQLGQPEIKNRACITPGRKYKNLGIKKAQAKMLENTNNSMKGNKNYYLLMKIHIIIFCNKNQLS